MTIKHKVLAGVLGACALLLPAGSALLPSALARQATQPAQIRLIPLQGGQNFRDLGGYRTRDGRTVRWGVLYRSGAMNELTPTDFAKLGKLGIRTVCDLRSTDERTAAPVRWPGNRTPKIFADDYKSAIGGLDMRGLATLDAAGARRVMAASYPRMLNQFNAQYRRMFGELLAGRVPLAFNCSAGKDRTGIAAALILTALDVPRETVIEDYLLSNRYFKPRQMLAADSSSAAWRNVPAPVVQAFMSVDRAYIEAALHVVDSHAGGAEGYLRDELGLGKPELATLRRMYTEGRAARSR